uniref:Chromatin assembly factor 1 subunit FAS2 isoform X1 n=1 Tax=Tanacetum cinerariifolium TaxID=118510 RepID=A0A699GM06_TANCI|nr:chromatin assembly factor 1 subunit FAS2 isoform X1 [Tanacetum cinerariifolium]
MSRLVHEGMSISVPKGMSRLVHEGMSKSVPEGMSRSIPEGMSRLALRLLGLKANTTCVFVDIIPYGYPVLPYLKRILQALLKVDDLACVSMQYVKRHLFHDDTFPSFFRRLFRLPDGSFLLVPAGVESVAILLVLHYAATTDIAWCGNNNDHHFNKNTANNLPLRGGHSIVDPSGDVLRLGALYS